MQLAATVRSSDEQNFKIMKNAYEACADEETIKKQGVKPLIKVLDEIRDVFHKSSSRSRVTDALLLLAKYGVTAFAAAGTGADEKNPDNVVVAVYPPWRIGLPSKERYKDDALVAKYQDVLVKVLSALYTDKDTGSFKGVVELEKKLASASPPIEDLQDVTVGLMPLSLSLHIDANNFSSENVQPDVTVGGRCSCPGSWSRRHCFGPFASWGDS
jgi:endothelin-converting enzyme